MLSKIFSIWILTTNRAGFIVKIRLVTSFERILTRRFVNWRSCWNVAFSRGSRGSFVSGAST